MPAVRQCARAALTRNAAWRSEFVDRRHGDERQSWGMEQTMRCNARFVLATTAIITSGVFSAAMADTVRVSVAAEPAPPLASKDASGNWEGFEVDLAKSVCKAGRIDCEIVATAWDGIIPALTSKKIDVIWASMTITPERSQQIAFTIPYYNAPAELIGNKDDQFDFTPGGLKGKTIGVESGTTFASFVGRVYPDALGKTYGTQDAAIADLAAGRIDLVMSDAVALNDFLKSSGNTCCTAKYLPKDPILDAGMAGGLRKEDVELKKKFDAGIKAIYANGEFNKIEKKYFDFDVGTPPRQ
jgi:polar amino acid transport system substrate-binding protein